MQTERIVIGGSIATPLVVSLCLLLGPVGMPSALIADPPAKLKNGVGVIVLPVPGAEQVAVESLYRVGFADEPEGATQISHLVEHLVCQAATRSYPAGKTMEILKEKGIGNAETLADFTHYDYVVPAGELELALAIEAERLTSLKPDEKVVHREIPKCYREADFVERNPQAGMEKHALMAFNQCWRYGAKSVRIRGGLEEIPLKRIEEFRQDFYRPANLLIVVAGGVERREALEKVTSRFENIPAGETKKTSPIDLRKAPKDMRATWDSRVRIACLAFAPPENKPDAWLLTLLASRLREMLTKDAELNSVAEAVVASDMSCPAGVLPVFFYVTGRGEVGADELRDRLAERLHALLQKGPDSADVMQVRALAMQLRTLPAMTAQGLDVQKQALASRLGIEPRKAARNVLANYALQCGMSGLLDRAGNAADGVNADRLRGLIRTYLDPAKQRVTILEPKSGR